MNGRFRSIKITMIAALLGGMLALGASTGCQSTGDKACCGDKTSKKACPPDCKKPCCADKNKNKNKDKETK